MRIREWIAAPLLERRDRRIEELQELVEGLMEDRAKAEFRVDEVERMLARWPVRTKVVVSLKSGKGFRGVLAEISEDVMILRNAELVDESEHRTPVDGEVFLERADVDFVQVPHR